jgi:c(7)-type cytochrome triheme protein
MLGDDRNRLAQFASVAGALMLLIVAPGAIPASDNPMSVPFSGELRLPADAVFDRTVGPERAVTFRHATHFAAAGNRCTSCHPGKFRILTPTRVITHRQMDAGASCGSCHDGRQAFAVRDSGSCALCHAGRSTPAVAAGGTAGGTPGTAGAPRGPKPIVYARGESSPGTVTFRHSTHLAGKTGCSACHPKPFAMKSAGARPGGAMHESTACGLCHDGKQAFNVEDDTACARCHAGAGGTP